MSKISVLRETKIDAHYFNTYASLMTTGNGYLGIRAAFEEDYPEQTRGMFVAGIYNRAQGQVSSDLVNLPDVTQFWMELDGVIFSLFSGQVSEFRRELDLATGELLRELVWEHPNGKRFGLCFKRFVSKKKLHTVYSKVAVTCLTGEATVRIRTGIDGQQTNFGTQHLVEHSLRVFSETWMQGEYTTTQSEQRIAVTSMISQPGSFAAKNRQLLVTVNQELTENQPFSVEKVSVVATSLETENPAEFGLLQIREAKSYDEALTESQNAWEKFWQDYRVTVSSKNDFDQLALDFAAYHLEVMTPSHDERFSVGAKGLTGEGYKGHVFWDTEIFIAPFHLYNHPEKARKLLRYRYLHLEQARDKAAKNGYQGALFPWESAFSGEEETPEFAAINVRTGKRQKVASAIAEHHIVADVAHAVVSYYEASQDELFMENEGLKILQDTARFWLSRAVLRDGKYVILDVIGPDEYTEHVDNNAYTNYLAHENVYQTLRFMSKYGQKHTAFYDLCEAFLRKIYLPQPNADKVIPQDDTFLSKPEIDLTGYKEKQGSQAILLDYSRAEVNEMQILKQADVVMLLYLMPNLFSQDIVSHNLDYYEQHTIHDSSLSKAIHAIVANRVGQQDLAYRFFEEACRIDLEAAPGGTDEGVHAASLGAIWLSTVFGFGGIAIMDGELHLNPRLPAEWERLDFSFVWHGERLEITLEQEHIAIRKQSTAPISIHVFGKEYCMTTGLEI
ncbi:glycoside hydrolase family 65 protein [Listeria booriae]|uniref:Glycoside hydrolase family 65 protein n=1 Tax=Listeria booriae TaxID=1552123 RepID=A0A7X0TMF6_9LIST|nr:glycoside hydrolase family 65 protein [Listeria booriae]MBC1331778.1 glycoside hydrolase family 65 protein [Listeria booriae]MBC2387555.1 glycoside hydrolase family 65 protein [Listeria booriae]